MYVLVSTPTSPGSTPETTTFTDIDALWEHVKTLKGYVEPPTQDAESLGLSTENRYLKGVLVDIYQRLDREFRSLKEGQQELTSLFLGPSPFNSGVKKVPNQELRAEPFEWKPTMNATTMEIHDADEKAFDCKKSQDAAEAKMEAFASTLPPLEGKAFLDALKQQPGWFKQKTTDISGNTVEYDPETSRLSYMTDIFKPDVLPKIGAFEDVAAEHNSEDLLKRIYTAESQTKPVFLAAKLDLFQKLFLDNFTVKTSGYNPNYKETFFCWILFVSSPQRFLAQKDITFPVGLKDVLQYDKVKLHSSFENICHRYTLNPEDHTFQLFQKLLKEVLPRNHKQLEFSKQRSWESVCCETLKILYEIADGKTAKLTTDILEPWIQFFLDAEVVSKKGGQIQSSVLFTDFCAYMSRIAKACDAETLFQHLIDIISIQHFSKTMKETYGIKAQRKAAGNFYVDIDYVKNGAGQGLTAAIGAADFADLHREAKTESSWAAAFGSA